MNQFFAATRYLIIIPIIGLGVAAAIFFIFGGFGLIRLLIEGLAEFFGLVEHEPHPEELPFMIEVVICPHLPNRDGAVHYGDWLLPAFHQRN